MTPNPPPQLSQAQRLEALEKAKLSRQERAAIKEVISKGELSIFDAINDPRESIRRMKVIDLLSAVSGVGRTRAALIMERAHISPTRRIGGLGHVQAKALGAILTLMKRDPLRGKLIVISGPGGVGKSTIASALKSDPRFWVSISATTREPRNNEKHGIDYYFYSDEKFSEMIEAQEFLEWAEFAGNRYGTPKAPVDEWRRLGKSVILEIEIEGARQVRSHDPSAQLIFISPPTWEELVRRLTHRGTDSPARMEARLGLAKEEMEASTEFDTVLVNDDVNNVLQKLVALATLEKGNEGHNVRRTY